MKEQHRKYFEMAIELSKNCIFEDKAPHPYVGAVLIKNNEVIETAYRGETNLGDHAEYILMDVKLKGEDLSGTSLYTTLEPCNRRGPRKVACAQRIVDRQIETVYIGIPDPNPDIDARGISILRRNGVNVEWFSNDYAIQIKSINSDFIRFQETRQRDEDFFRSFISKYRMRSLDEWYFSINKIYWSQNYSKDPFEIFSHLVEIVGGLSVLASGKVKKEVTFKKHMSKSLAWFFALCGRMGVRSLEKMIWSKYPYVCPYCLEKPHNEKKCLEYKKGKKDPNWEELESYYEKHAKPRTLGEWQRMFGEIYQVPLKENQPLDYTKLIYARLTEEIGELSEAIRLFDSEPGFFLSEASDLFAWLMHLINDYENANNENRGYLIEESICRNYPDYCLDCLKSPCICPPVIIKNKARLAHEFPLTKISYGDHGNYMTPVLRKRLFSY